MGAATDRTKTELRLALAMRGGVSLAVWIGGAVAEIDLARRASVGEPSVSPEASAFWTRVLGASRFDAVAVDVLAGASAGGLNGVLYSASQVYGFGYGAMRDIWLEIGGLDPLVRREAPWPSLLKGDDYFLSKLHEKLVELAKQRAAIDGLFVAAGSSAGVQPRLELELSATALEPILRPVPSPADEPLVERRHAAGFRFRRPQDSWLPSSFPPPAEASFDTAMRRLAIAGRATSSYPVAFEAAEINARRRARFGSGPLDDVDGATVDHDGTFLDRDSRRSFVVGDGGILDNIPIRRALDSVARSPASGPTERVLVYLQPGVPAEPVASETLDDDARRSTVAVVKGTIASRVGGETINADIAAIEAHNEAVERSAVLRRATFHDVTDRDQLCERAATGWGAYRAVRSTEDGRTISALLHDPVGELGNDPFPEHVAGRAVPDERWRSPIAGWPQEHRQKLRTVVREELERTLGKSDVTNALGAVVDPDPLRRVIELLLEWARWLEARDVVGASTAKRTLYRIHSFVDQVLSPATRQTWVAAACVTDQQHPRFAEAVLAGLEVLVTIEGHEVARLVGALRVEEDTDDDANEVLRAATRAAQARIDPSVKAIVAGLDDRPSAAPSGEPLLGALAGLVAEIASELADARDLPWSGELEQTGPWFVDRALSMPAPDDEQTGPAVTVEMLSALEILAYPEFVSGLPARRPVVFHRCSAANRTPLAAHFTALNREAKESGRLWNPVEPSDDGIHVELKLAGNELANFSAFLLPQWRANDWMWGRLDAVATLVDLLVHPVELGEWLAARGGTAAGAFRELLAPSADPWDRALWSELWTDSLGHEVETLIASDDRTGASTTRIRNALIARRQWDLVRHEMSQSRSSPGPSDPSPVEPTFDEVRAWLADYRVGAETIRSSGDGPTLVKTFSSVATSASESLVWNLDQPGAPVKLPAIVATLVRRAGPRLGAMAARRFVIPGSGGGRPLWLKALTLVAVAVWVLAFVVGVTLDGWAFFAGVGFAAMLVVPALWFLARWAKRLLGAPDEPG